MLSKLALALLAATLVPAAASAVNLVPYGAAGYRYAIYAASFPAGVELTGFDDSGFATGTAAFSNGAGCPILPVTNWPASTRLAARMHFNVAGIPVLPVLHFAIDNDVNVYVNGTLIGSAVHEGCANYNDYNFAIPANVIVPGANVMAALAVDRGGLTTFDANITADSITPTLAATWGALKLRYR